MKIKTLEFQIGIREHNGSFLYNDVGRIALFRFIKNPVLYWLADPFIININGKHFIFAEAAKKLTWKGKLVYSEINEKNPLSLKWKTCLKKDFHLSFPNVFIHSNSLYLMPETNEDNTLSIYKNINNLEPPFKWEKCCTLIKNKKLVDTIIYGEYLVSYDISNSCFKLELYSNHHTLLDAIEDHDLSLRPAGNIIYKNDNKTILLTQNCKNEYGEGIIFNSFEIKDSKMSIEPLFEVNSSFLNAVFSRKIFSGIHTYNFDDKYEVIDVRKEVLSIQGIFRKFLNRVKTIFRKNK